MRRAPGRGTTTAWATVSAARATRASVPGRSASGRAGRPASRAQSPDRRVMKRAAARLAAARLFQKAWAPGPDKGASRAKALSRVARSRSASAQTPAAAAGSPPALLANCRAMAARPIQLRPTRRRRGYCGRRGQ
nr:hypothetical protein [Solidesulfovibrio sp.]